tara:strand:- start:11 stop:412 length:402 start_codon:yes stop_codon:yes gene_type:complete
MTSYKVFEHHRKSHEIVKVGFAWLAPFNPIWPLFRGLWIVFISYIFVILILAGIDFEIYGFVGYIDIKNANNLQVILIIIQFILFLSPGFQGNKWTENNLIKKGYIFSYSIKASNKKEVFKLIENEENDQEML